MAGFDPRDPDRLLGRAFGEDSVRGFDATCSAPKSVSLLFAFGDEWVRAEVVAAHDAAVAATFGYAERTAHTRYRINGEVAVVDAEGLIGAAFRQHTSRALDPQLHTHLVISNRVLSPDGRWLALDARTIKHDQRTLSAIYHATLRAELTERLGVAWETPENGIAEIDGVDPALRKEFSARTDYVHRRTAEKLDRFVESMGREPTFREAWRLEREAVCDSRPRKPKEVDAEQLHTEWRAQAVSFGVDPDQVVAEVIGRQQLAGPIDRELDPLVAGWAIEALREKQSSWRPAEIVREVLAVCPTDTADSAEAVMAWAEELAGRIARQLCVDISRPLPTGTVVLRRDGRPVTESAMDRALTTQAILDQEAGLIEWADATLERGGTYCPQASERSDMPLTVPQAEAARVVAGEDELVLVVGPAGTGKTTALRPAIEQLRADGRAVFGVAPSANAAQVLSEETGVDADTIHKLLIEHRLPRPPDHRYDLPPGSTVIVDEAGMLPTEQLARLVTLAEEREWRIAMVGDPLQFSAVGRGGMFGLLVDTYGAIELDRVHRFVNEWERDASLRLRRGDTEVAEIYDLHGRLHAGTPEQMQHAIVRRWWLARESGDTVLLMTPTNEATEQLNQRCQRTRMRAGQIDPGGRGVEAGAYMLYRGDEITTRENDRRLRTDRGEMVRNRSSWTIDAVHRDGSLTVHGDDGRIHLPAEYVEEHVELGYARTAMAGQGRTVDGGLTYVDGTTDVRTIYTAMTRGAKTNEIFFGTTTGRSAVDLFSQSIAIDWIDRPAHTRRAELAGAGIEPRRRPMTEDEVLRRLVQSVATPAPPSPPQLALPPSPGPELGL